MGPKAFLETIETIPSSEGKTYAVKHNRPINPEANHKTDVWAVKNQIISITPANLLVNNNFNPEKFHHLIDTISLKI